MPAPRPNAAINGHRASGVITNLYLSSCPTCRGGIFRGPGQLPHVWCPPGRLGYEHVDCAKQRLAVALLEA